jgi:hypothetical protein
MDILVLIRTIIVLSYDNFDPGIFQKYRAAQVSEKIKLSSYNEEHLFEDNHGPSRAEYHQRLSTEQRKKYSIRRCRHQHLIHAEHVLSLDSFSISNTTQACR